MKKRKTDIVRILSIVIILASFLSILGWLFDIEILKSVIPGRVTMKFITAISFVFSGFMLFFINEHQKSKKELGCAFIPFFASLMLLIMIALLTSNIIGFNTYIEDVFVKEMPDTAKTHVPGRPAVVTMMDFIIIAIAGMSIVFNKPNLKKKLRFISLILIITGILAIIGHIINNEVIYFFVKDFSTGMAINTAILFTIYGIALVLVSKK